MFLLRTIFLVIRKNNVKQKNNNNHNKKMEDTYECYEQNDDRCFC